MRSDKVRGRNFRELASPVRALAPVYGAGGGGGGGQGGVGPSGSERNLLFSIASNFCKDKGMFVESGKKEPSKKIERMVEEEISKAERKSRCTTADKKTSMYSTGSGIFRTSRIRPLSASNNSKSGTKRQQSSKGHLGVSSSAKSEFFKFGTEQ